MPAVKVEAFGGMVPGVDDRLLQQYNAVWSENCYLLTGKLRAIPAPVPVHDLNNPDAQYAFRIPISEVSADNIPDSYWLEFENPNTQVVRSPVTGETDPRFYWADGQNPPGYTSKSRVAGGDPNLILGIPAPPVAPGIVVTGGSPPLETRAYVYTWMSSFGEEGQPSPPGIATGNISGTWSITMTAPSAPEMANRVLTKVRIYRTITSDQGIAVYYFVAEQDIADTTFDDTIPGSTIVLNNPLASADFEMPPADLQGIVVMPNGMMVGWRENEIWFSEPYQPHAWPTKYTLGVESEIIGIGTWGQSAVILCQGVPYTITGIHPSMVALAKIQPLEPCASKGSIVNTPEGVVYASINGLIQITPYGGQNVTIKMIDKAKFPTLLNVNNLHAAWIGDGYLSFAGQTDEVFQFDTFQMEDDPPGEAAFQLSDFTGTYNGSWINYKDTRLAFTWFTHATPTLNVMQDLYTGEVLLLRDAKVVWVDLTGTSPRSKYRWRSKPFQLPFVDNWGAAKIFWEMPAGDAPVSNTIFRWITDGVLRFEEVMTRSGQMFRLPSGYKAHYVQFEIEGELDVLNVQFAKSPRDLREV